MGVIAQKVSHDFVTFLVADKFVFGGKVIGLMTANAGKFTSPTVAIGSCPDPNLTDANNLLKKAIDAFELNPATEGNLTNAETAWIGVFSQDANYVFSVSKGDGAVIDLSGYNKTKDVSVKATQPAVPVIKSSKSNITGGLDGEIAKQTDAVNFITVAYTADVTITFNGNQITFTKDNGPDKAQSQASFAYAKRRKTKLSGLKSKSDMKTQTVAINTAGFSNPSTPSDNGIL